MAAAEDAFGYKLKNELKELLGTCGKTAKGGGGTKKKPPPPPLPPPPPKEEEVVMLDEDDHDL